jgi:hypothetical protein
MNRRAFDELNRRHGVEHARYFHQRSLLRACSLPPQFGLCAALVELWWKDADALDRLRRPTALMVRDLVVRQARHAYLLESPADTSIVGENDRALLELKCGTRELRESLEVVHGAAVAETHAWANCAEAPTIGAGEEQGLRLLLLRYRTGGHRMAFTVDPHGGQRFFDPNAGEVRIAGHARFAEWFADFWKAAGYDRRAPAVSLYRFWSGRGPS